MSLEYAKALQAEGEYKKACEVLERALAREEVICEKYKTQALNYPEQIDKLNECLSKGIELSNFCRHMIESGWLNDDTGLSRPTHEERLLHRVKKFEESLP